MRSTFSRSLIPATIILVASLIITGLFSQMLVKNFLTKRAVTGLKHDAQLIADLVQANYGDHLISIRDFNISINVAAAISEADAVICDTTGRLVLCAEEPLGCEHQGLMLQSDYLERSFREGGCADTGVISGLYSDVRYVVSQPVYDGTGNALALVIVSQSVGNISEIVSQIIEIFTIVAVVVVLVSVVLIVLASRQQAAPLRDMAKAASDFGHGELTARVKTGGHYSQEVEELALAFNNMANSLEKSEYRRQEFVANVSHELKTPMTTISGYVDGILDGTIPPEKQSHYLHLVSDETKRLSRLVRSMLDVSRLQSQGGIPEEQKTRFDLEESLGQGLISFEQKILGKNLDVRVDMPEHPVYTRASQDQITQVIYNLLDNAIKFSPQGGVLAITLREGGSKAYVSVANDGETIPPEELPLVFDRFHKIDKSRSMNRESWGLGLYIVKTIIGSHGEDISVTSRYNRTTFTFTMPLVN